MKSLIAAAALIVLAGSAAASDSKGNYTVIGSGAFTCGDFLSAPPEAAKAFSIWVSGYATALNQALPDVKDVSGGRTDEQMIDALANECNGHNDKVLADATRDMIIKMGNVKATAKKSKKKAEPAAEPAEEGIPELRH